MLASALPLLVGVRQMQGRQEWPEGLDKQARRPCLGLGGPPLPAYEDPCLLSRVFARVTPYSPISPCLCKQQDIICLDTIKLTP